MISYWWRSGRERYWGWWAIFTANGREVARWRLEGSPVREYTACIPADTVKADGRLLLAFVNPVSPAQLGVNADARQLAFGLQTFEVPADQGGC